jgi:hypothetical protein
MKQLVLSYSQISTFSKCEMMGYWTYVKEYEKLALNHNFIIGTEYHYGIGRLYAKDNIEKVINLTKKHYDTNVQEQRNAGVVSSSDEQDLVENKIIVLGMLKGYSEYNKKDIAKMKLITNESDALYPIPKTDTLIRIKLDNILAYKKDWFGHEIKTSKTVNAKYVENTQYSFQVAIYFHVYNAQFDLPKSKRPEGQKLSALLYDAVQKPGIRRKKDENEKQFLTRLSQYYTASDASTKFYKDTFEPKISAKDVYDTLQQAVKKITRIFEGKEPMKEYSDCAWCQFLVLCHEGGETKQNLVGFKNRYNKENKHGITNKKNNR